MTQLQHGDVGVDRAVAVIGLRNPFYSVLALVVHLASLAGLFLLLYAAFVFFAPDVLGDAVNYVKANPLVTPAHIVPE